VKQRNFVRESCMAPVSAGTPKYVCDSFSRSLSVGGWPSGKLTCLSRENRLSVNVTYCIGHRTLGVAAGLDGSGRNV